MPGCSQAKLLIIRHAEKPGRYLATRVLCDARTGHRVAHTPWQQRTSRSTGIDVVVCDDQILLLSWRTMCGFVYISCVALMKRVSLPEKAKDEVFGKPNGNLSSLGQANAVSPRIECSLCAVLNCRTRLRTFLHIDSALSGIVTHSPRQCPVLSFHTALRYLPMRGLVSSYAAPRRCAVLTGHAFATSALTTSPGV
eukprot:1134742-Rhodomonas_salina.1